MDQIETFAKRVRRLREEHGMTIVQLADAIGASEGTIRQIEGGTVRNPHFSLGLRLARHLGVDPYYLAFGEGSAYAARLEDLATDHVAVRDAVNAVRSRLTHVESRLAALERRRR
jgi:transcriptional regulator with XRE-family HTH domain